MKLDLAAQRSDQSLLGEILHGRAGDGQVIHDPRIDHHSAWVNLRVNSSSAWEGSI